MRLRMLAVMIVALVMTGCMYPPGLCERVETCRDCGKTLHLNPGESLADYGWDRPYGAAQCGDCREDLYRRARH